MPKNTVLIIGIVVVAGVILGGAMLLSSKKGVYPPLASPEEVSPPESNQPSPGTLDEELVVPDTSSETPPVTENPPTSHTVTYTNSGYSPSVITVNTGDIVTFVNNSSSQMWTASAIHPTHRVYPDTDIMQCGIIPSGTMFDACNGTNSGGSWSFTFQNSGTWKYHNHLNPGHTGTVVVE